MRSWSFGLVLGIVLAAGAASAGTVKIGAPLVMSGPAANVGQTALQGLQMAVDDINAKGGLLGSTIALVSADDAGNPATANTVTRNLILNEGVKALFPGSNSAAAVAEETLAGQYRVPAMFYSAADVSVTTTNFNRYSFQLSSSTYMDPRAVAQYVAQHGYKRVFTIAPDYNFGHSFVTAFLAGLKESGAQAELVGQQYPALGTTDFSSYIGAILTAKPDFVFTGLFAGDLITFIRQAKGYGLFDKAVVGGPNATDILEALKGETPAGLLLWARAPFFSMGVPAVTEFAGRYKAKFGAWPPEWPILSYAAVQVWAEGVRKAKSFDGAAVAAALSGATVATLHGDVTLRACDHQADAAVYLGTVSGRVDATYGFPIFEKIETIPPEKTMMPCAAAEAQQRR
jgi:branched-chain amino acid transport system substrate-binding protein